MSTNIDHFFDFSSDLRSNLLLLVAFLAVIQTFRDNFQYLGIKINSKFIIQSYGYDRGVI